MGRWDAGWRGVLSGLAPGGGRGYIAFGRLTGPGRHQRADWVPGLGSAVAVRLRILRFSRGRLRFSRCARVALDAFEVRSLLPGLISPVARESRSTRLRSLLPGLNQAAYLAGSDTGVPVLGRARSARGADAARSRRCPGSRCARRGRDIAPSGRASCSPRVRCRARRAANSSARCDE